MLLISDAELQQLSAHRVGNIENEGFYHLSEESLSLTDSTLNLLLQQFFLNPFTKLNEVFRLTHSTNLMLNEVYNYAAAIFANNAQFHQYSIALAKHLYQSAKHPNIKGGEFYIAYFSALQLEGETVDAIGLFKSENKETYLKVHPHDKGLNLAYEQEAVNINKLDKGCLILNTEKEEGYKVLVLDNTNKINEAVYWKDDFLQVKIRNDHFQQTSATLQVYKQFVSTKIDEDFELSKADKIDLLNRSLLYFKEKEQFDIDEFAGEVIANPQAAQSFKNYKKQYENDHDTEIADTFEISKAAIKSQARAYKSVLKLDKNFHIYIHGNRELIEKGFDDEKSLNYYKVFFNKEL